LKISVVVLNWNGKKHLEVCFEALRAQTFGEFNVFLVDNASTDGSVEFVREKFPEVNLIVLEENMGFAGGVNAGIRGSDGDFIALLNNDTRVVPGWLEALYNGIVKDEKIGFCASKMIFYYTPDVINSAGDGYRVDGIPFSRGIGEKDTGQYEKEEYVFGACAGAALYSRKMLEDIGLFDEDYFESMEDVDLSFRAQLAGYRCLYVPEAVVCHVHMATVGQFRAEHFRNCQRNRVRTLIKNMPAGLLFRHSITIFLKHLIEFAGVFAGAEPFRIPGMKEAYFQASREILKEFGRLLEKRGKIQSSRRVSDGYLESMMTPLGFNHYRRIAGRFYERRILGRKDGQT
jgi:GT2 family glycosyltransferase